MVTIVLQPGFAEEFLPPPSPKLDHSFTAVQKDTLSELYRGNKKTEHCCIAGLPMNQCQSVVLIAKDFFKVNGSVISLQ